MNDLRELYQELIVDHNRHPRNFGVLDPATHKAEGINPLCGDEVTVYLKVEDGLISDVRFEGSGCAISTASASLMTEQLMGKTPEEAESLFQNFHQALTTDTEPDTRSLGKLAVLIGVRAYPSRVKCATLAWHTLRGALQRSDDQITTE